VCHYGLFVRHRLSSLKSGGKQEPLRRFPTLADSPLYRQPAQSLTPSGLLPHRGLTPGAIDPRVTQGNLGDTICRQGYAATVRPPFECTNAMKRRLMRVYGVRGGIHDYELDHLILLELGGCPDCETNLWPQSRNVFPGVAEKDEVENYLHREVCSSALALAEAQREIAVDWYAVYEKIHAQTTRRRSN
jgi:hypothetical protein